MQKEQKLRRNLNLTTLTKCGQGSYGSVMMAIADESEEPLAIKIVNIASNLYTIL